MNHRIVTKEGLDEIVDEIYKIVPIDSELFFAIVKIFLLKLKIINLVLLKCCY